MLWSNDQYVGSGIVEWTLSKSRSGKIRHTFPNSDAEIHICINVMLQYDTPHIRKDIGVIPVGLPSFRVRERSMVKT